MEGLTESASDATKDSPLPSSVSDNLTAVSHAESEAMEDHPEGDTIRRQVEYYFSDENLSSDLHMLEKMNYNENRPISIDHICGFKKMRRFKKKALIAAALRRSAFLNVTADKKLIRKVPFIYVAPTEQEIKTAKVIIEGGRPIAVQDDTVKVANQYLSGTKEAPVPGKTKGITGFEEFYAETPVTPEEFKEELGLYHPSNGFPERIDMAIYRYINRRKFHSEKKNTFDKFLKFGGIECGPRPFGSGVTAKQLKEEGWDTEYIALNMGVHKCGDDKEIKGHWAIDFEGVAKAFLSSVLTSLGGPDLEEYECIITVMTNFYNYLLHHNVCNEYKEDINAAKRVCTLATKEIPRLIELNKLLPGRFNHALSILTGGSANDTYSRGGWDESSEARGIQREEARIVALTGLMSYADDDTVEALSKNNWSESLTCIESKVVEVEVSRIEKATEEVKAVYSAQQETVKSKLTLERLGRLMCKPYQFPSFETYDQPGSGSNAAISLQTECAFLFEESLLELFVVGMKLEATVRTIEFGNGARFSYLDDKWNLSPTYHTVLLNELIKKHIPELQWIKSKDELEKVKKAAEKDIAADSLD